MMDKLVERIFDFNKIPTKLMLLLWIMSGVMLFFPAAFLTKLNLTEFNAEYGKFVGVTFLFTTGFLVVTIVTSIQNSIKSGNVFRRRKEEIIHTVQNLDEHEKAVLREFSINGSSTLQLPIDNATVNGLHSKGIIYQVSNTGFVYFHGSYFPFSITEIALKEILKNSHLVGLPTMQEGISMDQRDEIIRRRPNWAKTKSQFG
jgi:hypothetical protein